jgi:hypothetical protein
LVLNRVWDPVSLNHNHGSGAYTVVEYFSQLKSINTLLRLLVENEIFRLNVWNNPSSDKRNTDQTSGIERNFTEVGQRIYYGPDNTNFGTVVLGQCCPNGLDY